MPDLIELLESFNRKERHFLVAQTLGSFELSDHFRRELGQAVGIRIPAGAYAAMDYHLDWLAAALVAFHSEGSRKPFGNSDHEIRGNQEDVDLLVAFKAGDKYHILLVEAKGDTPWSNEQMLSKSCRLKGIFGDKENNYQGVAPHYCLMSPRRPQRLDTSQWPDWMKRNGQYIWMKLHFPGKRSRVVRCTSDGADSANGTHFRIDTPQWLSSE